VTNQRLEADEYLRACPLALLGLVAGMLAGALTMLPPGCHI
jgi:hypothetical protein